MSDKPEERFTWAEKKKALLRQLLPHRTELIALSLAGIISAIANGVVPYVTGRFFDALVTPGSMMLSIGAYPKWAVFLGLWAVIQVAANAVSWVIDMKSRKLNNELEAGVEAKGFVYLLTLPVSFHKKERTGEITNMLMKSGWMLSSMTSTVLSLAPQFLTIIIGVVISFWLRPELAFILLIGVAVYLVVLARVLPSTAKYQEEGLKVWNKASGDASDAYANVTTVKQAGAEAYETKRILGTYYEKAIPLWYRMERAWSNMNFSQRVIVTVTQGAIFFFSVHLVQSGELTIGGLIAFNAYAGMIIGPFVSIGNSWQTVQNGLIALARAERIFGAAPEVYEPKNAVRLQNLQGDVAFDDVHFTYEAGQPEVLKGVSFEAKAGEIIAFVGETGVGKSTAAELISGYYFASSGEVRIDGHDIRTVNLHDLRRRMAVVPQEVILFNATIADNIRYGMPEATDAAVEEAAKRAYADTFIDKFPLKYAQEVGERGVKLSVGQKQRIAIARAMLRNPAILILDEPTSALDPETESFITKSLEELMLGRTTFIIAHRLSTVRKADRILVFKDGTIVEAGRHDDLVRLSGGVYRNLYNLHIGLHE